MDRWAWEQIEPWLRNRVSLRVGALLCGVDGPTQGRPWCAAAVRETLRRLAALAGVRRRFAPHQLRHVHAVEMAREGVPLNVIQRPLGHANLGITSIYLHPQDRLAPLAEGSRRKASGDGGPGDSFENLETSRIMRIPRGLRVIWRLGSVPPGALSCTPGSDRPASRRALGRLMDTEALGWFWSLALSRAPLTEEAREEPTMDTTCLATELPRDAVASGGRALECDGAYPVSCRCPDTGIVKAPAGGASFVSSPFSWITRNRGNGPGGPVTQHRDGPSSASVERARAEESVERARAERYRLRQREIRRGARAGHGRAHPSESEARGLSIPRLASGFVRRVGRLINDT